MKQHSERHFMQQRDLLSYLSHLLIMTANNTRLHGYGSSLHFNHVTNIITCIFIIVIHDIDQKLRIHPMH